MINKEIKLIILVICSLFIAGCSHNVSVNQKNEYRHILLNNYNKELNPNELFDTLSYRFIALETKKECVFGEISKVFIDNDLIFVLDKEFAKKAFIFNIEGKFITQVGKNGNGPNEYSNLQDIDIDKTNRQIILYDLNNWKILYYDYDGNFIKTIQFAEYPGMTICHISENTIASYLHTPVKRNKKQLLLFNEKGEIKNQYYSFVNKNIEFLMPDYFSKVNHEVFFIPIFYDKIYKIDSKSNITPILDFGISDLMVNDKDQKKYKSTNELLKLERFFDFEELVVNSKKEFFCKNTYNNKPFYIIGNLELSVITVGYPMFSYQNFPERPIGSWDDYFISTFHPYSFKHKSKFPEAKRDNNFGIQLFKLKSGFNLSQQ